MRGNKKLKDAGKRKADESVHQHLAADLILPETRPIKSHADISPPDNQPIVSLPRDAADHSASLPTTTTTKPNVSFLCS